MTDKPNQEMLELFWAMFAVTTGAINQGALDREKLIDHLIDVRSTITARQKGSSYAFYLETMIDLLEKSQFGFPPKDDL